MGRKRFILNSYVARVVNCGNLQAAAINRPALYYLCYCRTVYVTPSVCNLPAVMHTLPLGVSVSPMHRSFIIMIIWEGFRTAQSPHQKRELASQQMLNAALPRKLQKKLSRIVDFVAEFVIANVRGSQQQLQNHMKTGNHINRGEL
jgi:hypothetical protein